MDPVKVRDYANKINFLVGWEETDGVGYLRDMVGEIHTETDQRTVEFLWVALLSVKIKQLNHYFGAVGLYNDQSKEIALAEIGEHRSSTSKNNYWADKRQMTPEYAFALASLYGFGCTKDDPNLTKRARFELWDDYKGELWLSWQNDKVTEFVAKYKKALISNSLDFPPRVRDAMAGQAKVSGSNETPDFAPELQSDVETAVTTEARSTDAFGSSDPWIDRPRLRALWIALVGALVVTLLMVILLPKPPLALRGASIWVECLPGAGQVEILAGSELVQEECPESGLLPVASATLVAGEIIRVDQTPLDVPLAPHALSYRFASKVIWRPSPSFARRLTERESLAVTLACGREDARVVLDNDDRGERVLTCASPVTRFPVLGPEELRVALTVTAPTSSETCSGYFRLFDDNDITLDPTRACAQLSEVPPWTLPTRDFVEALDVVEDRASGLTWLEDPFAFGNTARWTSNHKLATAEFLSHVERETGLDGWRLASPAEVATVDPSLFGRTGGSENAVLGAAQDPNCDGGARRIALSTDPKVPSVDIDGGVGIPCLFVGIEVGFWIVRGP